MKTKTIVKTLKKPIHLHVEHISRLRMCLLIAAGLLGFALVKSDTRMLGIVRDSFAEGYGVIGSYLREETTRLPVGVHIARTTTISGR